MKIIDCIALGVACLACTPSDYYTLQGTLPENSKATEVYLLSREGKGADKAQNEYWDILGDEKDPLQVMLDMQKSLQVRLLKMFQLQ